MPLQPLQTSLDQKIFTFNNHDNTELSSRANYVTTNTKSICTQYLTFYFKVMKFG